MRALSAIRLSVLTDETTSPDRQRAANDTAAAAVGAHMIGEALDLGVSASKTSPFERPELGKWLARPAAFDAVIWWRFDRAVRSMRDLNQLADWAAEHHKVLVFAEGPGGRLVLDFRSGIDLVTRLLLQVFAFAAEFEAASIRDRVTGAQAALRNMPLRWRGSRPPYTYKPEELPAGGWTLVPDTEPSEGCGPAPVTVLERIIAALAQGSSPEAIALALTADNIPTPRDYWRLRQGRASEGAVWKAGPITTLLRNPTLMGYKTHQGQTIFDPSGNPVMATTTPVLSRNEFDAVGAMLAQRSRGTGGTRTDTRALLLGIAHCDSCSGRMYLNTQESRPGQRPTYKCNSKANGRICEAPVSLRADWLEEYAEDEFITALGPLRVAHTVEIPGYDPGVEIAEVNASIVTLTESMESMRSETARKTLNSRLAALDARLAVLEAAEPTPARTEVVYSGSTYAEEWAAGDTAKRRAVMLDAGAVIRVTPGKAGGWRSLDTSRVSFALSDVHHAEAALELEGVDYS